MNLVMPARSSATARAARWIGSALAVLLVVALVPAPAQAQGSKADQGAAALAGTWVGTNTGFENGVYVERELRLIITKARGTAFSGSKGWRDVGATTWEGPEPVQGIILRSGEVHAADADGVALGTLVSPRELHLVYTEVGGDGSAFLQKLVKQKGGR